jgi:hypothetical protein
MACLPESVYHGGDAQRPFLAMGFGDFQALDRLTYQEKIKPLNIQGLIISHWWGGDYRTKKIQHIKHSVVVSSLIICPHICPQCGPISVLGAVRLLCCAQTVFRNTKTRINAYQRLSMPPNMPPTMMQ